ncbi:MAG: hypothetical protein ACRDOP_00755, partial [Gaiellaceae bacterium]
MTIVLLGRDLIVASRIMPAAARAGATLLRIDDPTDLPPPGEVSVLLVDWGGRGPDWGERISSWRAGAPSTVRLLLFGPHTDLAAHADARASGLGPMRARSRLPEDLA